MSTTPTPLPRKVSKKIVKLENQLANLTVGKKKKSRKRRKSKGQTAYGPSQIQGSSLTTTIARTELIRSVRTDATGAKGDYVWCRPDANCFPWLEKMYNAFSEARWESLVIFWKPAVSANTDGRICYAFDTDGTVGVPSRADVLKHGPCYDTQIWQDTQAKGLVIPKAQLQQTTWIKTQGRDDITSQPGAFLWYATGPANKDLGEVWASYKVTLSGPR